MDNAATLFARNGYASTGVAEIGDTSGLARGALYYYIGSKESLLAAIHDRVMDPLLDQGARIVELPLSPIARLILLSECLLRQIITRHEHVWVFLHEYRQLKGENRDRFRQKRNQFENYISDLLRQGTDQSFLEVEDVELTTLAFLNLHNYSYQWIGGRIDEFTPESLARVYSGIFFGGVAKSGFDILAFDDEVQRGRDLLFEVVQATVG